MSKVFENEQRISAKCCLILFLYRFTINLVETGLKLINWTEGRTHLFENVLVRWRGRAGNRLLVFNRQTILVRFCLELIRKLIRARRQRLIDLPLLFLRFHAVAATIAGTPRLQHLRETELEWRQFDEFFRTRSLRERKQLSFARSIAPRENFFSLYRSKMEVQ